MYIKLLEFLISTHMYSTVFILISLVSLIDIITLHYVDNLMDMSLINRNYYLCLYVSRRKVNPNFYFLMSLISILISLMALSVINVNNVILIAEILKL